MRLLGMLMMKLYGAYCLLMMYSISWWD